MTAAPRIRLIAQIHIAKKQLALDDASYRDLLAGATGKTSCSSMTPVELQRVVEACVKAGFKPAFKGAPDGKKSSRAGVRLIFGLWTELGNRKLIDNPTRPALLAFVKRMTSVEHPDWLDNGQVNQIVEALKAIKARGAAKSKETAP
jgi:phage gp16-like protein